MSDWLIIPKEPSADERRISRTEVESPDGTFTVSTVYLTASQAEQCGAPIETLVFYQGSGLYDGCMRWQKVDEAVRGHDQICREIQDGSLTFVLPEPD